MIKDVAPADLIRRDFKHLKKTERLNTTPEIEDLLFMQSQEGRAHNGAGLFHKRSYVNTTIDDIVKALHKDPTQIKSKRQKLINEIFDYAKEAIKGKAQERLVTKDGRPLLGIPAFTKRQVNPHQVLRGLYMGGLRDDPPTRKKTEEIFDTRIGFGRCYLVNIEVMDELGFNGQTLAHQEHEDEIDAFREAGLIIEPKDINRIGKDAVRYLYIRHKLGPGHSDDAAIVAAGILYNVDVALGVFLADAIDTLEKYAPQYFDQDSTLSHYIRDHYKGLKVSMDKVYELTHLAAIPEGMEDDVPDCSLRYFLTRDPVTNQSALESHLNFIEGKPFFPIVISYKRIIITKFYQYIRQRIATVRKQVAIISPEVFVKGLDRAAEEVMQKTVVVVSPDTTLKEALSKMLDEDAQYIVVQDEQKQVVGVVNPSDFLHLISGKRGS